MSTPALDPDQPRYPHVQVQLSGQDGNAYSIIGRVAAALSRSVNPEAASEFTAAAKGCGSYDEVVALAMATVDVH